MKVRLNKYIEKYGDGIHGTPQYDENGEYYFINGNNFENGKIVINKDDMRICKEEYNQIKRPLNSNTLLLSINGSLGKIAVYNNEKIALGKSACYLNIYENENKYFVKYVLSTKEFQKYIQLVAHGSTIKNLAPSQIVDYEFEEPKDRNKLAFLLKTIDDKIENNNQISSQLEQIAKTIYDYWFLQFDFPDENGKPYQASGGKMVWNEELKKEIPEGWKVGNLYDIADFINGIACQKFKPTEKEETLPVIKIKEMHNGITADTEVVRRDIPEENIIRAKDIIFSWSATLEVIKWYGITGALNQHIFKVIPKKYGSNYTYMQLKQYIINFAKMAEARKTTMGHITTDHIRQSKIFLPSEEIVKTFEQKTKSVLDKLYYCQQENEELISLRDFLLPLLMNGQVGFKGISQ